MASKMQPEVISREFVKPSSSSTPNYHPAIHKFCFFDQLNSHYYAPLVYFYESKNDESDNQRSSVLKNSLSAALSRYYPLAGRIKDDKILDCNDEGVLFLEARMECNVSEILNNPDDDKILKPLFPDSLTHKDSAPTGPVAVQVTYFKCGGMSIGICLCHKLLDMASMASFISDWASLARKPDKEINPEFINGSLYPPLDLPSLTLMQELPLEMKDCVSRRVFFDGSKIAKLKKIVGDLGIPNPTRVEVVASLLYKSAIFANAKASSSGFLKPSLMNCAMNLRGPLGLSERNKGNLSGIFPVSVSKDTNKKLELGFLVSEFRKAKTQFLNLYANTSSSEEVSSLILNTLKPISEFLNGENELYSFSSICGYPFYETDFGWGKPLWVALSPFKLKNLMILMDTKERGGIEASICLEEKAMAVFENDQDLLSFRNEKLLPLHGSLVINCKL